MQVIVPKDGRRLIPVDKVKKFVVERDPLGRGALVAVFDFAVLPVPRRVKAPGDQGPGIVVTPIGEAIGMYKSPEQAEIAMKALIAKLSQGEQVIEVPALGGEQVEVGEG